MSLTDLDGLGCVYLSNDGTTTESVDNNSTDQECWLNGVYWAPGWVDPSGSTVNISSDGSGINIGSTANGNFYWTSASAMNDSNGAESQTPGWGLDMATTSWAIGQTFALVPNNFDPSDPGYQLAVALGRNGAYTVNNVCFVGGFYAASATAAGGYYAATTYLPELATSAGKHFPGNILEFAINQSFKAAGHTPTGFWTGVFALPATLPIDAQIVGGAIQKGCSNLH